MRRLVLPLIAFATLAGLMLAFFAPVLLRDQQFAYRDAGHFYYPLYLRVQQEWDAGRIPLWEPEENGGMPLLGNPTAAVLYPGKLVYAALAYPWAARVYILLHVLIAVAAQYGLLRHWRVSRGGAALGALCYAFAAPVVFQYCNVIFLVGAAWAPLGLLAVDLWVREHRRRGLLLLAVVLALQTLGGDPQTAYVTGLAAAMYALGLSIQGRDGAPRWLPWVIAGSLAVWVAMVLVAGVVFGQSARETMAQAGGETLVQPGTPVFSPQIWDQVLLGGWLIAALGIWFWSRRRGPGPGRLAGLGRRLAGLGAAGFLAILLTSAQLLPVLEYSSRTVRAAEDGSHDIFPFSLEPWRVAELIWPGIYGSQLDSSFWMPAIGPVHGWKVWVPSLYLGGFALLLALRGAAVRRGPPWRVWLTGIALATLLLSFGEFGGPLWLARNVPVFRELLGPHNPVDLGELRRDGYLGDGTGSPYWLLAWSFPGFRTFRYPSKLLVFSCLGLAALAGMGWDRFRADGWRRATTPALALALLSGLLLLATFPAGDRLQAWWQAMPEADRLTTFGPFDADAALRETRRALAHGIAAAAGLVVLAALRRRPRVCVAAALILLALDLAIANRGLIRTVPQSVFAFEDTPEVLAAIERDAAAQGISQPYRIHRMPIWEPIGFRLERSSDRVGDLVRWERRTIQPKYAIPHDASYTLTQGTAELYDLEFFFGPFPGADDPQLARAAGLPESERLIYFPRKGFDLWNTLYFVLPYLPANDESRGTYAFQGATVTVAPDPALFDGPDAAARRQAWARDHDWQVLRNQSALPRAWVVHQFQRIDPIQGMRRRDRAPVMEAMLYQGDDLWYNPSRRIWNPRSSAWLEMESGGTLNPYPSGREADPAESVAVTCHEPLRVELDADLTSPGIVVLADVYYPGWKLEIDGAPTEILRVNRLMRGAAVASGRHHLVYTYEPASFRYGVVGTSLGLVVLAGCGLLGLARWWAKRVVSD